MIRKSITRTQRSKRRYPILGMLLLAVMCLAGCESQKVESAYLNLNLEDYIVINTDYLDFTYEKPSDLKVSEEEIESAIALALADAAEETENPEGLTKDGDKLDISYVAEAENGDIITKKDGYSITLGKDYLQEKLQKALIGHAVGDVVTVKDRIADDFAASSADQYEIVNPYEDERINNVNLFISQYCAYRDTDVAAISLEDMKQLLRSGIGELYDYTYEDETREIEETVLNEDGEEVTELREVTVRVYTLTYRGEAYFADSIFHLTAEQKTLAQNFAENLSLFLGDGLFQNLSSSESGFTIPALGDIRYTDGSTEVVYYNQLDERYANKPYGTDDIGGYGCGPTAMAMVVSSLTDDLVDPVEMAKWSYEHGYWCSGSGSYHALIPAAAEAWGLPVSGCTASEPQRITDALSSGKLIVAIMSAGHFTSSGHFIVLRGVKDEKILVADPASRTRSEQGWELSIILNEASKAAGSGGPFWIIG